MHFLGVLGLLVCTCPFSVEVERSGIVIRDNRIHEVVLFIRTAAKKIVDSTHITTFPSN